MRRITKTERRLRRLILHGTLVAGSFLFSVPFIWLVSTSCKVPDEMYPPRWIPQVPARVIKSPYIELRENERPLGPTRVKSTDWERLRDPIAQAITVKVASMSASFPGFYQPYLTEPALADGILNRLLKRVPEEIFEKTEILATAWFAQNVTESLVREVFETVYRRVSVSEVVFHGWDVSVEYPTADGNFPWQVVSGDVTLVDRKEGLLRPAKEVHYSFENQHRFALTITLPIQMNPANLKKIVVTNYADRSWHELWATVELNGKRYQSVQAAYLGSDRSQDITWQFASEDDKSIMMKTWLRLDEAGASDFNQPGRVKLTLDCHRASGAMPTMNKYANNYKTVWRMVPLLAYVKNSLLLVVLNVLGQILGSSLVAYSFARLQWPARDFCFLLVLATLMIPPQVTMIPVFLIYKYIGWYNTLRPLWVSSLFGSAFYIFLLRQFMKGIPKDLEDSAKIDGCGYIGIFTRIIFPLVKPAVATIGIFTFMGTWNDFMGPLIYLNDQRLYPLSLGLFALQVFQGSNFGLMMAASVLMTLPVIILFFAAQRQFIQGITLTGIKG
ncbi:MAG: ABC transporter permease subunit [Candidatus Hydrogenedentes bacterium]|nr:ABC transporter permease subunit [Candidatus Hydrogenedentota bacterium]